MKLSFGTIIPAAVFIAVCIFFVVFEAPRELLTSFIGEPSVLNYSLFVLALATAVVLMPLTAMPLIPLGTMMFGPLPTALLSILGWTIGAIGAFLLARTIARPLLARFVDLETADAMIADYPPRTRFLIIVLMRLTIPVDIASYALGMTRSVRLGEYIAATLIGVSWFSFAFAYLGDALIESRILVLVGVVGISTLIFAVAYLYLRKIKQNSNERNN